MTIQYTLKIMRSALDDDALLSAASGLGRPQPKRVASMTPPMRIIGDVGRLDQLSNNSEPHHEDIIYSTGDSAAGIG